MVLILTKSRRANSWFRKSLFFLSLHEFHDDFPWWTISFVLRLKWEERTAATSSMTMWDNDDCYCDGVVMFYQIHTSPLTWLRFTLTWLQSRFLRLQSTFSFESFFFPTIRPSTFIIHILDCQIILFGLSVETVSIYIYMYTHVYIYIDTYV